MANFGTTFKALNKAVKVGLQAAAEQVRKGRSSAAGKSVRCPHCEQDRFVENPSGLGWLIRGLSDASVLVCAQCGRIQIFMRRVECLTPPAPENPSPAPLSPPSTPKSETNPKTLETQDEHDVR